MSSERFAEFVREDKGGLVLDIEIAAQLQCAMALDAVDEDRDRHQESSKRELAAREDCPRCDAELMLASLALVQGAGLECIDAEAATAQANGIAASDVPSDLLERLGSFRVRHAGDPS